MNSQSFPPRSRLRTDTAQSKVQGPVNNVCRGRHEGLEVGTKNSDFPVEGELFPLTSPFIELPSRGRTFSLDIPFHRTDRTALSVATRCAEHVRQLGGESPLPN